MWLKMSFLIQHARFPQVMKRCPQVLSFYLNLNKRRTWARLTYQFHMDSEPGIPSSFSLAIEKGKESGDSRYDGRGGHNRPSSAVSTWLVLDSFSLIEKESPARSLQRLQTISSSISLWSRKGRVVCITAGEEEEDNGRDYRRMDSWAQIINKRLLGPGYPIRRLFH